MASTFYQYGKNLNFGKNIKPPSDRAGDTGKIKFPKI